MNQHPDHSNDLPALGTFLTLQNGKIREETSRLAEQLQEQAADCAGGVRLDFENVEYVASEELGALVALHKKVRSTGGQLSLINVRPQVSEVFSITRLDTLFHIHKLTDISKA